MHDKEVHWKELSFRVFCGFGSKFGFSPELRLFSHPEQLIQSEFSDNADSKKCNSSLFLPSTPDTRQCDKANTYNSPTKPYKLRFRGVILFRINFVFGYYTYTKASSGGERAQTATGCSRSCCFAPLIILASSLGSSIIATTDIVPWHFGQTNGSTSSPSCNNRAQLCLRNLDQESGA